MVLAIQHLHKNNILYRDIKPENILFVTGPPSKGCGKLKLTDFGSATKLLKKDERMKDLYGTSYYMAPEMVMRNYDINADTWSIGVLLFVLLKGRMLVDGKSDAEILDKIINHPIELKDKNKNEFIN